MSVLEKHYNLHMGKHAMCLQRMKTLNKYQPLVDTSTFVLANPFG